MLDIPTKHGMIKYECRGFLTFFNKNKGLRTMTDNVAILDGYTKELMAYSDGYDLHILVKPETDLDTRFKAWCCAAQEYITVNGWLFKTEEVKA